MIEYVRGKLADLEPTMATVDCMGVGYGINISLNTYSAIQGNEDVKLWIYESIREDAFQLWGFATKIERSLFLELITVSGIGAGIARMILSAMTPSDSRSSSVSYRQQQELERNMNRSSEWRMKRTSASVAIS